MDESCIERNFHITLPSENFQTPIISGFRFLDLPIEVRQLIYHYVYAPDHNNVAALLEIYISYIEFPPSATSDGCVDDGVLVQSHFDKGLINLQLANRQIFEEANPVYYQHLLIDLELNADHETGAWDGIKKLHERFRQSVRWLIVNEDDENILGFFSSLRGIIFRRISLFETIKNAEDLMSVIRARNRDSEWYIPKLLDLGAKSTDKNASCWFEVQHDAFTDPETTNGDLPLDIQCTTWIWYNSETKSLELTKRQKDINRPDDSNRYDIANFPTQDISPYRHAPYDPKLAPKSYSSCMCQHYLLQLKMATGVELVC